mgnify:CR=1 FL=1
MGEMSDYYSDYGSMLDGDAEREGVDPRDLAELSSAIRRFKSGSLVSALNELNCGIPRAGTSYVVEVVDESEDLNDLLDEERIRRPARAGDGGDVWWQSSRGPVRVVDMDDAHLQNTLHWILRHRYDVVVAGGSVRTAESLVASARVVDAPGFPAMVAEAARRSLYAVSEKALLGYASALVLGDDLPPPVQRVLTREWLVVQPIHAGVEAVFRSIGLGSIHLRRYPLNDGEGVSLARALREGYGDDAEVIVRTARVGDGSGCSHANEYLAAPCACPAGCPCPCAPSERRRRVALEALAAYRA